MLQAKQHLKVLALKVVAVTYERCSFTRGFKIIIMMSWLFTSQVVSRNRRLPVIRSHISEILSTSLSKALLLEEVSC